MENHLTLEGKGRKKLRLTLTEIQLLQFLEQEHLLSTEQLFRYYSKVLNGNNHAYSFKNRLRKLEEYKLIKSDKFAETFEGERFKYYGIWSQGVEILKKAKLLDEDYNTNQIYHRLKKKNVLHFLMTQEVVLNTIIAIHEERSVSEYVKLEKSIETKSLSPSKLPYEMWIPKVSKPIIMNNKGASHARRAGFSNNSNNSNSRNSGHYITIIKPDWILKRDLNNKNYKSIIVNIELDTGTEQWPQIEEKLWNYCIVAESNKDSLHIALLVVPDKSFSSRTKYGNRTQRVNNMIKALQSDDKLLERAKEINLIIRVIPLRFVGKNLAEILG